MTHSKESGFTLIEVMIALIIIAISLTGITVLSSEASQQIIHLKDKTTAYWVAENALTQLLLGEQGFYLQPGEQHGNERIDTTDWVWRANIMPAPQATGVLKIQIEVGKSLHEPALSSINYYVNQN